MSSRVARLAESNEVAMLDRIIKMATGNGTLPSICPQCKSQLDFGKIGQSELICRNSCGWEYK